MRQFIILVLVLVLAAPVWGGPAEDITRIVSALEGGQIREVLLQIRIRGDGSATGSLQADLVSIPPQRMEVLIDQGNRQMARQAEKLARKGVRLFPLELKRQGGDAVISVRGEADDALRVPTTLSSRDPVALTVVQAEGLTQVKCVPRPILFLLAPLIGQLRVQVELPDDPVAHNATKREGRNLIWNSRLSLPTVEFSWR